MLTYSTIGLDVVPARLLPTILRRELLFPEFEFGAQEFASFLQSGRIIDRHVVQRGYMGYLELGGVWSR